MKQKLTPKQKLRLTLWDAVKNIIIASGIVFLAYLLYNYFKHFTI